MPGYSATFKFRGRELANVRNLRNVIAKMEARDEKHQPTQEGEDWGRVPYFPPENDELSQALSVIKARLSELEELS